MPIHIDDEVSSLSAYPCPTRSIIGCSSRTGTSAGGVAVLSVRGADPFKGQGVARTFPPGGRAARPSTSSVKKHRNDVCRLATLLSWGRRAPRHERGGPAPTCGVSWRPTSRTPVDPNGRSRSRASGRSRYSRCSRASPAVAQLSDSATVRRHLGRAHGHPASFIADYLRHTAATGYLLSSYWALLSSPAGCEG